MAFQLYLRTLRGEQIYASDFIDESEYHKYQTLLNTRR